MIDSKEVYVVSISLGQNLVCRLQEEGDSYILKDPRLLDFVPHPTNRGEVQVALRDYLFFSKETSLTVLKTQLLHNPVLANDDLTKGYISVTSGLAVGTPSLLLS